MELDDGDLVAGRHGEETRSIVSMRTEIFPTSSP